MPDDAVFRYSGSGPPADWRVQALAAISEGFCPNGHGPLRPLRLVVDDDGYRWEPSETARWCGTCGHAGGRTGAAMRQGLGGWRNMVNG